MSTNGSVSRWLDGHTAALSTTIHTIDRKHHLICMSWQEELPA